MTRKVIAFLLALGAMWWLFFCMTFVVSYPEDVERQIEKNWLMQASFEKSVDFVENFKIEHSRLPSKIEFERWTSSFPFPDTYSPRRMRIEVYPDNKYIIGASGSGEDLDAAQGSYIIQTWNGDFHYYYAPWNESTNLPLNKSEFLNFKTYVFFFLFTVIPFLILAFSSFKTWPKRKHKI